MDRIYLMVVKKNILKLLIINLYFVTLSIRIKFHNDTNNTIFFL